MPCASGRVASCASRRIVLAAALAAAPLDGAPQEAYRCTSPDGRISYQQSPCPGSARERKVDVTPANATVDPGKRDELLKKGDEAGRKLEARAAAEDAERRRRAAEREREEQREREARAQEEAREIYGGASWHSPNTPWPRPPGSRPAPPPRPVQPLPKGSR
jgi:hypothetical protein